MLAVNVVMEKLRVQPLAEAVAIAERLGLLAARTGGKNA